MQIKMLLSFEVGADRDLVRWGNIFVETDTDDL